VQRDRKRPYIAAHMILRHKEFPKRQNAEW
jgi:hypothetical protein